MMYTQEKKPNVYRTIVIKYLLYLFIRFYFKLNIQTIQGVCNLNLIVFIYKISYSPSLRYTQMYT